MRGYTRQEVAQRAGVDPGYVDRLVELGILTPEAGEAFSPGDALRARWLQSLERAGVPLEGLAAAVRDGVLSFSFLDVAAYDRFAGLSGTTFQQLSADTGIPLELLMVVREAFGMAEPHPDDTVRASETAWARAFLDALQPHRAGVYVNFLDADDDTSRVREAYADDTYRRLAEVKAKYDPGNVFHNNKNILPSTPAR